jgi:hypothetical protein
VRKRIGNQVILMASIRGAQRAPCISISVLRGFVAIYKLRSMSRAAKQDNCLAFVRHHHRLEATSFDSEPYADPLRDLRNVRTCRHLTMLDRSGHIRS